MHFNFNILTITHLALQDTPASMSNEVCQRYQISCWSWLHFEEYESICFAVRPDPQSVENGIEVELLREHRQMTDAAITDKTIFR